MLHPRRAATSSRPVRRVRHETASSGSHPSSRCGSSHGPSEFRFGSPTIRRGCARDRRLSQPDTECSARQRAAADDPAIRRPLRPSLAAGTGAQGEAGASANQDPLSCPVMRSAVTPLSPAQSCSRRELVSERRVASPMTPARPLQRSPSSIAGNTSRSFQVSQ
jgi:hypothetical protein